MICPYHSKKNRCTHKPEHKLITSKKRVCGYKNPKDCEFFLEWVELHSAENNQPNASNIHLLEECMDLTEKAILTPIVLTRNHKGDKTNDRKLY